MSRPFKNALCNTPPPVDWHYLNFGTGKPCFRRNGHPGPHRNRFFEWDQGVVRGDFSDMRPRRKT